MIKSDIVVNVSGPVDLKNLDNECQFIKEIKNLDNNFNSRGFLTDKNFIVSKKILVPGILAYNFNPSRQTIIKAITNNARRSVNYLLKKNMI